MVYVGTVISILALGLALWNFYYTQLRKFELKVFDAGRYDISLNFFNPKQIALYPILIFENLGVKSGIVENIALRLLINNKSYVFIPIATILSRRQYFPRTKGELAPSPDMETFCSFLLTSKEVSTKKIMFGLIDTNQFELAPGNYKVEIYVKTSNNKELELVHGYNIDIATEDLEKIERSVVSSDGPTTINIQDKRTPSLNAQYSNLTCNKII